MLHFWYNENYTVRHFVTIGFIQVLKATKFLQLPGTEKLV